MIILLCGRENPVASFTCDYEVMVVETIQHKLQSYSLLLEQWMGTISDHVMKLQAVLTVPAQMMIIR